MTIRGLLVLVLWLGAGLAFTEFTVLGVGAWLTSRHPPWTSVTMANAGAP